MLSTTCNAVREILRADPSVNPGERARLLALLRAGPPSAQAAPTLNEPRILRRAEVARRLAVSLRAIDAWSKQGVLAKIRLPGRIRSCGFREADVVALIGGRA